MRSIEKGLEKAIRERENRRRREVREHRDQWGLKPPDMSRLSAYLVSLLEPRSLAAEQFKRLRTKILQQMKTRMESLILVTSAIQGEGKTTTALNLAITIAQGMSESVLLVDTDVRKPGLHTHLGIEAKQGLVDYLQGEQALSEILMPTEIPKLTLLPSGKPPENPSELLASDRMSDLLHEIKTRYENRYVVIDSSPINVFTDTAILAPQVDGVLLVVQDGATPRDYVVRALSQINHENLLGICLNQISAPESLQDSYYYYSNYANYGK